MPLPSFTPAPTRNHSDNANVSVKRSWEVTPAWRLLHQVTDTSVDMDDGGEDWSTFGSDKQTDTVYYNRNVSITILARPSLDEEALLLNMARVNEDLTTIAPAAPTWVTEEKYGARYQVDELLALQIERYDKTKATLLQTEHWENIRWNSLQRRQDANGNETIVFNGTAKAVYVTPADETP